MTSFKMTYILTFSITLLLMSFHFGGPTTTSAQSDEQEPTMAIEDTYVPQSKEEIKAKEGGAKATGEDKVSEKKGKASEKKGKASVKRAQDPSNPEGPTVADVRAAKKAQGLKGHFFQDSKSKKYFLQDFDGTMYKFAGNEWVKIKEADE